MVADKNLWPSVEIQVDFAEGITERLLLARISPLSYSCLHYFCNFSKYLFDSFYLQDRENSYTFIKNICAKLYLVLSVSMLFGTPHPTPIA